MPSTGDTYSAQWIGIGGAVPNDYTLIQTGTSSDYVSGAASYNAWYELLPAAETPLPSNDVVEQGDVIHASVMLVNSISNVWDINISDTTRPWTYNTQITYNAINGGPSKLQSAEVIEERPEFCSLFACELSNLTYFNISKFGEAYTGFNGTIITVNGVSNSLGKLNYSKTIMLTNDGDQTYSEPLQISTDNKSFAELYGPLLMPEPAFSDEGQSDKVISALFGGGPYTYNWFFNGNLIGGTSNTLQIIWNSANVAQSGSAVFAQAHNASVTLTSENDIVSISNQPLSTPIISTQNVVDGNYDFYINTSVTGGSSPYTYNIMLFNSQNTLMASGEFTYNVNTLLVAGDLAIPGSYYAKAVVEDAAGVIKSSINSNTIVVNPILSAKLVPNLGNKIDLGETSNALSFTAYVNGGAGPFDLAYNATFYVSDTSNIITTNELFTSIGRGEANSLILPANQIGTYIVYATFTDEGAEGVPAVYNGPSNPIIVATNQTSITNAFNSPHTCRCLW